MKKIILIIILITGADLTFAQGTYKDENTGLTIDYPARWRYDTVGKHSALISENGSILLKSEFESNPSSPDDFIHTMQSNAGLVKYLLAAEYGDDYTLVDQGLTVFCGINAYYFIANITDDFNTGDTLHLKAKFIQTIYDDYSLEAIIMARETKYEAFLPKAEELLNSAYFSE